MPQHIIFSFAKQVQSLDNTLSSAGLVKSGRKTFIFKGRQHILIIEPDLLYKQGRRTNFYIKPITFPSTRSCIAKEFSLFSQVLHFNLSDLTFWRKFPLFVNNSPASFALNFNLNFIIFKIVIMF